MVVDAVTQPGVEGEDGTSSGDRQEAEVTCHSQDVGREKG